MMPRALWIIAFAVAAVCWLGLVYLAFRTDPLLGIIASIIGAVTMPSFTGGRRGP